jgi:hypothetical protein
LLFVKSLFECFVVFVADAPGQDQHAMTATEAPGELGGELGLGIGGRFTGHRVHG